VIGRRQSRAEISVESKWAFPSPPAASVVPPPRRLPRPAPALSFSLSLLHHKSARIPFHHPKNASPAPSSPAIPPKSHFTDKKQPRALTFAIDTRGQRSLQLVLRHRARLQHLLVQVLLLQGCEVGFQLVFVDGFGDGHAGDCVADFLGEFVLLAELFPGAGVRCQ